MLRAYWFGAFALHSYAAVLLRCSYATMVHNVPLTGFWQNLQHLLCGNCRAKTEQAQEQKPAKEKPERGSASKTAAKAPASAVAKPKPRAKSGMDKTERDVHHVLYKVIGQVGCAVTHHHLICVVWPCKEPAITH